MTTGYSRVDDEAQKFERLSPSETALRVVGSSGGSIANEGYYDTISGDKIALAVSGTAQQITTVNKKGAIAIRAGSGNTGRIFIGDSTVDKTLENGIFLDTKDYYALTVDNLSKVYFDGTQAGDIIHINITYVS